MAEVNKSLELEMMQINAPKRFDLSQRYIFTLYIPIYDDVSEIKRTSCSR